MKNVLPVAIFAVLVLSLPHGTLETLSMIGLLVTAGIAAKRIFKTGA